MPQSRADCLIYAHISKLFCRAEPTKSGHRSRVALIAIPIIIVLLLGGAALGGWWLWDRRRNRGPQVRNCPALTSHCSCLLSPAPLCHAADAQWHTGTISAVTFRTLPTSNSTYFIACSLRRSRRCCATRRPTCGSAASRAACRNQPLNIEMLFTILCLSLQSSLPYDLETNLWKRGPRAAPCHQLMQQSHHLIM